MDNVILVEKYGTISFGPIVNHGNFLNQDFGFKTGPGNSFDIFT
jgi:hypothetical protein